MYMLDTDVCIGLLRGTCVEAFGWFRSTTTDDIALPALVEAELRLGTKKKKNRRNRDIVEAFLEPFTIVPFDSSCAQAYAALRAELEGVGTPIGPNDMIIAATALANGATLVTNNVREYQRVKGLKVVAIDMIEF